MIEQQKDFPHTEILRILPHRYPFLFIDKAELITAAPKYPNRVGRKVKAIKNFTFNEPFFGGHFPHRPVVPGVILLECFAQASIIACFREEEHPQEVAFAALKEAKFRAPVVPGDTLEIYAEVIKDKGPMILLNGELFVKDKLVVEAQMLAHMHKKE